MTRRRSFLLAVIASRAAVPLILAIFLLLYIGIAFFSPEPLTTLIGLTARTPLCLLLALVPLNCGLRLLLELRRYRARRRLLRDGDGETAAELFDEQHEIVGNDSFERLAACCRAAGYRTATTARTFAAWRGVSLSPARMLFSATLCLLFSGIVLSTTLRTSFRDTVIEGEPFLPAAGGSGTVSAILLEDDPGWLLARTAVIEVTDGTGSHRRFGLYPPAQLDGSFVYLRYLGLAPLIRFSAPELPEVFENFLLLAIYPPGKEDSAVIPGSPYRLFFRLAPPEAGNEPFRSGRMTLEFRVLKGETQVLAGRLDRGGQFAADGYGLAFPEVRRLVTVDLIRDYGVYCIWAAALGGLLWLLCWLSVRLLAPRREMLFIATDGGVHAYSRSEGAQRQHDGVFHETLDLLATPAVPAVRTEGEDGPGGTSAG